MPQAQHRLPEGQHHFEQSENIIAAARRTQINEVALRANDVLRNEVALRANGHVYGVIWTQNG